MYIGVEVRDPIGIHFPSNFHLWNNSQQARNLIELKQLIKNPKYITFSTSAGKTIFRKIDHTLKGKLYTKYDRNIDFKRLSSSHVIALPFA